MNVRIVYNGMQGRQRDEVIEVCPTQAKVIASLPDLGKGTAKLFGHALTAAVDRTQVPWAVHAFDTF